MVRLKAIFVYFSTLLRAPISWPETWAQDLIYQLIPIHIINIVMYFVVSNKILDPIIWIQYCRYFTNLLDICRHNVYITNFQYHKPSTDINADFEILNLAWTAVQQHSFQ